MSDKNLQASVELQVNTPGAEKVTQLKKEITELLAALNAAGGSASTSLDKASSKIAALSAKAAAARDKELTAEQAHARKLELIEKQKELATARQEAKRAEQAASVDKRIEAERERHANKLLAMDRKTQAAKEAAEAKRVQLATTADAKVLASANNMAAVQAQILARQDAADQRVHDTRMRRLAALAAAQQRAAQAGDLARLAGVTQQSNWDNGGRILNPNTARTMAFAEDASRGKALAEAAGLAQANSFGGKFKSAIVNWGRTSGESFMQSFKSSMSGGMGTAIAGIGAIIGVKAAIKDNMLYQELKNQITLSAGSEDAGAKEFEYVHSLAIKNGRDIKFIGEEYAKFSNSAKLAGASVAETHKIFTAVMDYAAAWHLSDAKVKRAMAIDLTEPLDMGHFNGAILNRSMPANLPGAKQLLQQAFMNENNLDEMGWKKAVSKGQVSGLGSELLMAEAMSKSVAKKLADANKSAQAELGRLMTTFRDFNVTMGAMGAFDGFTRALRALSSLLNDTGFQAAFAGLARGVASFSEALAPAITYVGEFIKKHPVLVEWVGRWIAVSTGLRVALALVGTAVGILFSPITLLAGAFFTAGSKLTAFGTAARLLLSPLTAVGAYVAGPLIAALRGVQVAGAAGMGGLAMFRTGVDGVRASLARMMSVAVLAAGAMAAFSIGKGVFNQRSADASMEKGGRDKMTRDELMNESAILGAAITHVDNASGAGDIPLAKRAARKQLLTEQKQSYDNQLALLDKQTESAQNKKTAASLKKAMDEALAATEDGKAHTSMGESHKPTREKKPRGEHAQDSQEASAQKQVADQAYTDRIANIKQVRADAEASLKDELEDATISYAQFYEKRTELAKAAFEDEKKALQEKIKGDIAAEKTKLSGARDHADVKASNLKITALEKQLVDQIATLEAKRSKELTLIGTEEKKLVKDEERYFASMLAKVNALNGLRDNQAAHDAVDAEHEGDYARAKRDDPDGSKGYSKIVDSSVATDKRVADMRAFDERAAEMSGALANKEAEIQLKVLQGLSTKKAAEGEILALKKEQALENIKLLEQEAKMENPLSVQLKIQKDLIENKKVLAQVSAHQVELENTISSAASEALQSVLNGTKGIGGALKSFVQSVTQSILKMLSDDMAGGVLKWMKGNGDSGGGIVGLLGSMFGGGATKGTAGGAGTGGGIMGSIGSLFSGSGASAGALAGGASSGGFASALSGIASVFGFSEGGAVFGAGSGTSDSIPADLSHGEYVFTADDVDAMGGAGQLDSFRKKLHTLSFADGGSVSSAAMSASSNRSPGLFAGATGHGGSVVMNISTPDANSFRSSKSQLLSQYQFAAAVAARRNG